MPIGSEVLDSMWSRGIGVRKITELHRESKTSEPIGISKIK